MVYMQKESKELTEMRNLTRWYVEKGYEFDYVPIEERDSEQAKAFLLKAEEDLNTAKRAYRKRSYNDSITHTQQAVEKTGKSILIATGLSNTKELKKKFSHNFSTNLIKKLRLFYSSLIGYSDDNLIINIIKWVDNFFETYKEKRKSLSLVQTIDELTVSLKSYENIFSSIMNKIETLEEAKIQLSMIETYRDSFEVIIDELEKISNQKFPSEVKDKLLREYCQFIQEQNQLLLITNTVAVTIILIFISILSMNLDMHFERSRYPKKKDEIYTKTDEIVKVIPIMMKALSRIIDHYYYIISINNEIEEAS